ncbi:ATPase components of ABC transporters with duplicated ATPase domains [Pseudonocardia thermophila]|uniref:ATPase components of ABC transporters with duplicated ATPase domains n=1 Tax=Pseudonocardia thermophila TaxID=1848 RepID=A0A1M6ZNP6_PSETH|nr:ABC-F family ATP-binding cassette domain-containing protein [Pseudonocardia thermophila]SHL32101.1 ATPase components of ABC transporters with duplicated ATPase domains [Pseudonocardia thermophila]
MPSTAVVCRDLSFSWPDGTVVLDGLDLALDGGRTGLVGANGSGKSTLLRLIAGELTPAGGEISVAGGVGYLPQTVTLDTGASVADLLGISERLAAIAAVEAGDASAENLAVVDDDWLVEERARAVLDRLGLPVGLDRSVGTLSGGEAVLAALAGLLVDPPEITLLDEPTNNLDEPARERLHAAVDNWPGTLVVVSHDRELLEHVDRIVELRAGAARTFTGTFRDYTAALEAEQEAARRMLRVAEADLAREKRQRAAAEIALARRKRYADKAFANKRMPKVVMNLRRAEAQVSAGKYRNLHDARLDEARAALAEAEAAVRDDDRIRIDLPATAVPAGRIVADLAGFTVRGPERIGVVGRNGAGKTTLLRAIHAAAAVPVGYLPQRLDVLDDDRSVLDNVRAAAPTATPQHVRAQLARFLVRGADVDRPAGTLSGGERFRVCLARLLLADPAPQLLLLDEPTNNLDLDSVAQLVAALSGYRGALVVATHDRHLLADIGVDRVHRVERP